MSMTNQQVIKECRQAASRVGLTFKRANTNISGAPAYKFVTRKGANGVKYPENIFGPITLSCAYDNVCSGYIDSWNGKHFEGVNHYA